MAHVGLLLGGLAMVTCFPRWFNVTLAFGFAYFVYTLVGTWKSSLPCITLPYSFSGKAHSRWE